MAENEGDQYGFLMDRLTPGMSYEDLVARAVRFFKQPLPMHGVTYQRWLERKLLERLFPPEKMEDDRQLALWVLEEVCECQMRSQPLPQPVSAYLAIAFEKILSGTPPGRALGLSGHGPGRPSGGRQTAKRDIHLCFEFWKLRSKPGSRDDAIAAVAESEGSSRSTVEKAIAAYGAYMPVDSFSKNIILPQEIP